MKYKRKKNYSQKKRKEKHNHPLPTTKDLWRVFRAKDGNSSGVEPEEAAFAEIRSK